MDDGLKQNAQLLYPRHVARFFLYDLCAKNQNFGGLQINDLGSPSDLCFWWNKLGDSLFLLNPSWRLGCCPTGLPAQKIRFVESKRWRVSCTGYPIFLQVRKQTKCSKKVRRKHFLQKCILWYFALGRELCCKWGYSNRRSHSSNKRVSFLCWYSEKVPLEPPKRKYSLLWYINPSNQWVIRLVRIKTIVTS